MKIKRDKQLEACKAKHHNFNYEAETEHPLCVRYGGEHTDL